MATVRTVTLPDGSTFTMSDWGDYPLHSRAQFLADTAQDTIIFNYVQSNTVPGGAMANQATILETNMPSPGQLPLRHQMVIFSIGIRFDESDGDNRGQLAQNDPPADGLQKWQEVINTIWFQFLVENSKPYSEGPVDAYPIGGGLVFVTAGDLTASATADAYYVCNGEQGAHAARRLAMPIHLGALEAFNGVYKFPRGDINFSDSPEYEWAFTCFLRGPRQRPMG